MPTCSPAMTRKWTTPVAMKFSVRPDSSCSRWPSRTASAISAERGVHVRLQQPVAPGADPVQQPRKTQPAARPDHRDALGDLGVQPAEDAVGALSGGIVEPAGILRAAGRGKLGEAPHPVAGLDLRPLARDQQRCPAGGGLPRRAVAQGDQVHLKPARVAPRYALHRIERRGRQPAGRLDRHRLDAHRLGLVPGVAAQVVGPEQRPPAMVPRAGRARHRRQHREAADNEPARSPHGMHAAQLCGTLARTPQARAAVWRDPRLRVGQVSGDCRPSRDRALQSVKPPAAEIAHVQGGSGQSQSSRMPTAAAANTSTNGW